MLAIQTLSKCNLTYSIHGSPHYANVPVDRICIGYTQSGVFSEAVEIRIEDHLDESFQEECNNKFPSDGCTNYKHFSNEDLRMHFKERNEVKLLWDGFINSALED